MIRMTPQQFALFKKPRKAKAVAVKRKPNKRKDETPENMVEGQILGFLQARGWLVTRQQVGLYVPARMRYSRNPSYVRIGTKGDPDWRAERPVRDVTPGVVEYLLFECKAPGQKPSIDQFCRLEQLALAGFKAWWFDSLEKFQEWYERRF